MQQKRYFKNNKGCLLNVELMDMHGTQIQATFFNDACEKYEPILKQGCVFLFSSGQVKLANQRFQRIKNDFCLIFDKNAEIVEVPDDRSINELSYNFSKLNEVVSMQSGQYFDFIGIVSSIGSTSTVTTRQGVGKTKRIVTLVDETNLSIDCCLWAEHSDMFEGADIGSVVACKGAKLVDFQQMK